MKTTAVARATTGSSTAPRCSSPRAPSATSSSCSRAPTPSSKQKGITAFILEQGTKGFSQRRIHGKLGMPLRDTAELILENVEVPDAQRLGEVDHGFIDTLQILDRGRITIGALARRPRRAARSRRRVALRQGAHSRSASPSPSSRPSAGCSPT